MSAGVLKYTVVRRHPDTLSAVALEKGSEVPDWASDLVDDEDLEPAAKAASSGSEAPAKKTAAKKTAAKKTAASE